MTRIQRACCMILLTLGVIYALQSTVGVSRGIASYRYPFERAPRGTVRQLLEAEIAFYQHRLAYDPQSGLNLAALAGTHLKMSRATGDLTWLLLAEQTAHRSLRNLPYQNSGALLVLARVAEARHEFAEAVRLANQAGGVDALAIVITSTLATGNVDEASKAAVQLVRTLPGLGSYGLLALVEIAQGKDGAALAHLHQAIASEEAGEVASSAWARTVLARLHYRRGRLSEARSLYRETLRILPQYPSALLNLAELEMRQGQYKNAEDNLTQVVNITRASPNVYDHAVLRGLARARERQGDRKGASRFWGEAEARLRRDVTSDQFGHRRELARLLLERGRPEDLAEALGLMRQEVYVRRDAETLHVLAWALSKKGLWLEAQRTMRETLRWGVRDAGLFYRAALIEQALGHRGKALFFRRLVTQTDPTFDEDARHIGLGF
jgi:tetratricopeptide (TPR) repeat protein